VASTRVGRAAQAIDAPVPRRAGIEQPADGRRVLRITEQPLVACADCPLQAQARASRWDLRECLLCLSARATSRG
jgi:hypothetical protein